jgi:hypothetical protein
MITSLKLTDEKTHYKVVCSSTLAGLDQWATLGYMYPVDGAWIMCNLRGVPILMALDTIQLARRLEHRYKVYPTFPEGLTDFK